MEEYKDQRCLQQIVKNAKNAKTKTIGQAAVRAKMLM